MTHFYHRLTHKYVTAFGSLFDNITLVRYNNDHTIEMRRSKVPLIYGPREKYLTAINEERTQKSVKETYPRMYFSLTSMSYDADRKQNSLMFYPRANNIATLADYAYMGVPYTLSFDLGIVARHKDDAYQIVEQILPIFNPNFTFSQILIPELGFIKDIPVILTGVNDNIEYEDGFENITYVEYILNFTMKVHYYGPVVKTKIIRRAFANTFIDPSLAAGAIVRVNLDNGNNGTYQLEDICYQGNSLQESTAAGYVTKWDSVNAYLRIGGVIGDFKIGREIKAASTNAVYTLSSFDATPLMVHSIKIEPDPITANVGDPFGFAETIREYPITDDE